jgi:hypothetical protein
MQVIWQSALTRRVHWAGLHKLGEQQVWGDGKHIGVHCARALVVGSSIDRNLSAIEPNITLPPSCASE